MEKEFNNTVGVWLTVVASLTYCYYIAKLIPKGRTRLCSLIPIFFLFLYLPLKLNTFIIGFTSSFFISWLANFRLFLFAFDEGPLSSKSLSLMGFILVACLPLNFKSDKKKAIENKEYSPLYYYPITIALQAILLKVYFHRDLLPSKILLLLYCFHFYLANELKFYISTALARALVNGLDLEPGFNRPFLATSIQNFWGNRWNLVVSGILRPTIFDPVRSFAIPFVGKESAYDPAVLATFFVSGLLHELLFYHAARVKPTWEVTCLFLLHGICTVVENRMKKALKGKFSLPRVVSTPLVIIFVSFTSSWLFILPMVNRMLHEKLGREIGFLLNMAKKSCGISR